MFLYVYIGYVVVAYEKGNYLCHESNLCRELGIPAVVGLGETFDLIMPGEQLQIDLRKMIKQLVTDIQEKQADGVISAKFHNTIAAALLEMAKAARENKKLNTVALSGGVFCNRYLTVRCVKLLKKNSFTVLFNQDVPSNDGGISVGQAAIAANIVNC